MESTNKNTLLGRKLEFGDDEQIAEYSLQCEIWAGCRPVSIWIDDTDNEFYYNCPKCDGVHRMHNEYMSICECKQLLVLDTRFGEYGLFVEHY